MDNKKLTFNYYEDYLYAYYSRSYKAALYLVLSEKHLDFKQIKRVINITTRFGKTVVENCVVIYLDENKSADLIKQLISERIVNIISFENKNY